MCIRDRGTYIFNSKDLCMVEYIPEMMDAGIDSFKIEGRMKTALYVATVTLSLIHISGLPGPPCQRLG